MQLTAQELYTKLVDEYKIFKPFASKEDFLSALNETRYQYPQTRHTNGHWLKNVLKNYQEHTGILLEVR